MKIPITINLALMLISGFAQNLTGEDQHKGLVFYYDYSEVSEGKVSDKSGNGYAVIRFLPAPEGEDRTNIMPFFSIPIVKSIGLMFLKIFKLTCFQ